MITLYSTAAGRTTLRWYFLRGLILLLAMGIPSSLAFARITDQGANTGIEKAGTYNSQQAMGAAPGGLACAPGFNIVEEESPGTFAELNDVSAIAHDDVWAVGDFNNQNVQGHAFIEHYDGTNWTRMDAPTVVATSTHRLSAVDARTSSDVWAVGYYFTADISAGGLAQTLVTHWNGNQWSVVPSPNIPGMVNTLSGVAALSANDVWAVGVYRDASNVRQTLTMHWNGTTWSIVPSPNTASGNNYLSDVVAISSNDVWAVGFHTPTGGHDVPHVMHWNGTAWSLQSIDVLTTEDPADGRLLSVAATAANDIWAVGSYADQPLVEHWNGTNWTRVSAPSAGYGSHHITSVAAISATDAWMVGYYWSGSQQKTLVQHWDGTQWSIFSSVTLGADRNWLYGVAAISAQDVWAVGKYEVLVGDRIEEQMLIEHYSGGCTTPTITPTSTATATSTATNTATATPTCGVGWSVVVGSPEPTRVPGRLQGVSASSSSDAWAVGWKPHNEAHSTGSLLHWDGSSWASVPLTGTADWSELAAVAAISPLDAWAVGMYSGQTATFHWNGVNWTRTPSPPAPAAYDTSQLRAISVVSPTDIWAVGYASSGSSSRSMIIHWNGLVWDLVTLPPALFSASSTPTSLFAVKAISANDVWVAGGVGFGVPTLLHWDGNTWSSVPASSPNEANYQNYAFFGLDGTSSNDVWVVGGYQHSINLNTVPVAQHWNGSNWSDVPTANIQISQGGIYLRDVEAISSSNAWLVGTTWNASAGEQRSLIEHWNGSTWTLVAAPENTIQQTLDSVEALSDQYIWAVGSLITNPDSILIDRYSDYCAISVPVGQATATATATNTPTMTPTNTPTRTATTSPQAQSTACPVQFADVPSTGPGSTFYSFVRCLACRNIVSGYPCGGPGELCNGSHDPYFRPGLNVTRGQISKMVALGASLSGPTGAQIFEDVEPGSTFYGPIQQLASRGYIGGYPCGGPSEPCEEGDRPYFRPGANTTRGQLSKIVSEAAQFDEAPGPQKFADVPDDSPFFAWINRLANKGAIGGYACGGPGEECDAQARPYFRPGENVTRGQTSKIVANTFYPNCQTPARK
ncbi:MAG TPA: S-layer homology domain-containing protein [Chloroflexia bacterium]